VVEPKANFEPTPKQSVLKIWRKSQIANVCSPLWKHQLAFSYPKLTLNNLIAILKLVKYSRFSTSEGFKTESVPHLTENRYIQVLLLAKDLTWQSDLTWIAELFRKNLLI
jgi:hypothetical protein